MDAERIGLAFAAGLVAALNPCGFAMLPGYLALVVRGESADRGTWSAVGRALAATAAMAVGFVLVFGGFGLLTLSAASAVQRYLPHVTVVVGVLLVGIGIWLLTGRELKLPLIQSSRLAPSAGIGSMFGYGIAYALASLSCTAGPFLAVTGAAVGGQAAAGRIGVFASYAAGFTLVVGVLAVAAALAGNAIAGRLRRLVRYVNAVSGLLLVVVGCYVAYYGWYEIALFSGDGDPSDPVITAAAKVQGTLAGWVYRNGGWPWLATAAALILVAAAWAFLRRARVRNRRWFRSSR